MRTLDGGVNFFEEPSALDLVTTARDINVFGQVVGTVAEGPLKVGAPLGRIWLHVRLRHPGDAGPWDWTITVTATDPGGLTSAGARSIVFFTGR